MTAAKVLPKKRVGVHDWAFLDVKDQLPDLFEFDESVSAWCFPCCGWSRDRSVDICVDICAGGAYGKMGRNP